jgi:hypothetical protein
MKPIILALFGFFVAVTPAYADESCDVQQELTKRGHFDGPINCKLGPMTRQAIEDFQREQGLFVDGIVGEDTYKALFGRFRRERVEDREDDDRKAPRVRPAMSDQEEFAQCGDDIIPHDGPGRIFRWRAKDAAVKEWQSKVFKADDQGLGPRYSNWDNASDKSAECLPVHANAKMVWECTVKARPCRTGN